MIKKVTLKKVALISTQALALPSLLTASGCSTNTSKSSKTPHAAVVGETPLPGATRVATGRTSTLLTNF